MIGVGSVVAAFTAVALLGGVALLLAALLRHLMLFRTYRRVVSVGTFTVLVGLWGAIVGGMFWIAA